MTDCDSTSIDRRTFLAATGTIGAAAALPSVASAHGNSDDHPDDDGELIVGYTKTHGLSAMTEELPEGTEVLHTNETLGYALVEPPSGDSTYNNLRVRAQIANSSSVSYVEKNRYYHAVETPESASGRARNDAGVEPNDNLFEDQYAPDQVRAPKAWEKTRGSDDVTIAVVDTGMAYEHPDLKDRFGDNVGRDFVGKEDDDDPGRVAVFGEAHATHVAGIASATTDNGKGVAGMSDSRLLACRVLGPTEPDQGDEEERTPKGVVTDIADSIQWATDQGADLINMSLGGGGYSQTFKNAVSYAVNNGTLPICAAGNDCNSEVSYPARFGPCMAVSAIDENEELANFSNYGENVDVAGPGVDVLSCMPELFGSYGKMSGTSMACPAVTGVAALGKAVYPDLSPEELRHRIKQSAVDVGLSDEKQGAGRVDALKLVDWDGEDGPNTGPRFDVTVGTKTPHVGQEVYFSADDVADPDGYVESWEWDFDDGETDTGEQVIHAFDEPGEYDVTATITDDDGKTSNATRTIEVRSGQCGAQTETTAMTGTLPDDKRYVIQDYEFETDEPCQLLFSDFDLPGESGTEVFFLGEDSFHQCGRRFVVDAHELLSVDTSTPVRVGVYNSIGSVSGDFEFTIQEQGFGNPAQDNEAPSPKISVDSPVTVGESVEFDASDSNDPDGSIEHYEWTLGDGTSKTGTTVSHTYEAPGEYVATLSITDDHGTTRSTTTSVTVETSCKETTTATEQGSLEDGWWFLGNDEDEYIYPLKMKHTCSVTLTLSKRDGDGNADLYANLDGSIPTPEDAARSSAGKTSDEKIIIDAEAVSGSEIGILVDREDGNVDYTLEVTETGSEEEYPNQEPHAGIAAMSTDVDLNETVPLQSASHDPDGTIEAYEWSFGDGKTATGKVVEHSWSSPGEYTVELAVTDDEGATATATKTFTVSKPGSGSCGDEEETKSIEDRLRYEDGKQYSYETKLDSPCQVTISLDGEDDGYTDFDLYVTLDGREPTPKDFDRRAATFGTDEKINIETVDADSELGVLVYKRGGQGPFTLSFTELGA